MLKYMLVALAAVIAAAPSSLQAMQLPSDANITGHVIDAETGEHIPFFNIHIVGTNLGAVTDASGHYAIHDLKPGHYDLEASLTGYVSQTRHVHVVAGQTVEVNFEVVSDAFLLDQVVVTGSKSEQKRRNSPSLINVVNDKTLRLVNACTLADGLNFQPGVRVENDCQNCGFTQVRINGLDGHYSQILMNSRPVFSALAGVYGLEHIPANMIERIEVMRGGGSALFGSSAIGGTINVITRDPSVNSAEISHTLTSIGISGALDNNTTVNASIVAKNQRTGLFIYGQSRNRDGYDHDGDGFTEVAQLKTQTLGARSFISTSDLTKLTVEYHTTHEFRRGGDRLNVPAHEAMIAEQVDHNIHTGEATFDIFDRSRDNHISIFAATQSTRRQSYYGSHQDPDAYGRTSDLTVNAGSQWTHAMHRFLFMPAELVTGLEYNHNRLHDVTIGYDHDALQTVNIYSAYVQNEWRDDRWGFLVGARLDKHSLVRRPVLSPRANIRFNPSQNLNLRLSYSTGFRSPQAYDEDFHIAIVGGERVVTVLAPDLKSERSNSVSASADIYHRFGNVQTNALVEGFYTDLRHVFALRQLDEPDAAGNDVLERYNGAGASVVGANIEAKAVFPSRIEVQAGCTWQRSRYSEPEQWSDNPDVPPVRRMFRTPDIYGYLTGSWNVTRKLTLSLSGTLTGPMLVQHIAGSGTHTDCAVTTPAFFDCNLKATYDFRLVGALNMQVSAGIINLFNSYQNDFDRGADRDSGYIYGPSLPRSLTFTLRLSI